MSKLFVLLFMCIFLFGIVAIAQADSKFILDRDSGGTGREKSELGRSSAPTPVPEPMSIALLGGGLLGLYRWKKKLGKD